MVTQSIVFIFQMASLRLIVYLISLISSATAIQCYAQALTDNSKPTKTLFCLTTNYCTKSVARSNDLLVRTYGCSGNLCLVRLNLPENL
ncbi:hypothetical protein GCK32_009145, partial [Trichostrongylus colubriformis]